MGASFAAAAECAARQNGRIATKQLHACGFGKGSIEKAVLAGRLHRVHVGVYAVGHLAPSRLGEWHAAVLACGPGAVLSHRSAATLWRIRDAVGPRVDVTIPTDSGRRRPGIRIHRGPLAAEEVSTCSDVPVTSPARTMVDLAHELDDEEDDVQQALREMQYRRLFDRAALELANGRRPNAVIGRLLRELAPTGSPLEVAFLNRVVRRHGLPMPLCQAPVEGFHVDFLWPAARLVVEIDGTNHDAPAMRAADAVRDNRLLLAGFLVLRYRHADIHRHHARTAAQIRSALARGD